MRALSVTPGGHLTFTIGHRDHNQKVTLGDHFLGRGKDLDTKRPRLAAYRAGLARDGGAPAASASTSKTA